MEEQPAWISRALIQALLFGTECFLRAACVIAALVSGYWIWGSKPDKD